MKRMIGLKFGTILLGAVLLGGCGQSAQPAADTQTTQAAQPVQSEITFTSDWELVEFSVSGKTTKAADMDAETRKDAPAFRCEDGEHCVVTMGGKEHNGTITEENGKYVVRYDDTDVTMTAEISGDTLTMINDKGTVTFIFRAK